MSPPDALFGQRTQRPVLSPRNVPRFNDQWKNPNLRLFV